MEQHNELIPQTDRYDSTREAWESIWDSTSVEQELQTESYARAQKVIRTYTAHLPKDAPILEAGSGLSAALITLKKLGFQVMGVDYAVNALHASKAYDPSLVLTVGDVHALPYAENTFGGYLSFGVFEHFETGMEQPLAEAFRVLKPEGILVLTIPYPNVVNRLVRWRRERKGETVLNDDDFYESTYTRNQLAGHVLAAGFEILHIEPTSHSFTLWGLGSLFRAKGYYRTNALAEGLGAVLRVVLPWAFNFTTLVIARKS